MHDAVVALPGDVLTVVVECSSHCDVNGCQVVQLAQRRQLHAERPLAFLHPAHILNISFMQAESKALHTAADFKPCQ